jgi:MFS family permease
MQDSQAMRARWAVAAMFMANGFVMGAWAPQIPLLLPRHQITEGTLGLLILVLGLGAVGSMLFAGRLIARFGGRLVLSLFSLALIPALPAVVFSPSIPTLALFMAVFGAMAGCMDVAMNAQAVEVERRLHRAIMSSSHGFWSLGGFFGGSAGSFIIAHLGSEVQSLVTAGVTACLVFGALPFLLPTVPVVPSAPARTHLLPRDAGLWLLGFMAFFSMVPEGAVLDWAAIYLQKELGSDVFRSGLAFAFFAGAMAVMRFAGDAVRNRFGAVRTLRVSGLIGAAGLMGGALAPYDWVAIVSFAIAGLGVANMVPIMFSAAGNRQGVPSAVAISTVTMVGYCGILVAPASIGWVAEHFGFRPTYAGLSLLLVAVALLAARVADADNLRHEGAAAQPA